MNSFPNHSVYHTLRDAINGACGPLYSHLPLKTADFTNFDVAAELNEPGAVVVAEIVKRVPDPNRAPKKRVDFFCYKMNGDVVRHHPGHTRAQSMTPHCMPWGSLCFHIDDAAQQGVGASLHLMPPRMVHAPNLPLADHPGVPQPGDPALHLLATREDLKQLSPYDIKCVNWSAVREELRVLPDHNHTVDWSDGSLFPWWAWLANMGHKRDVMNDGIAGVELEVRNGKKCVLVHSVRGDFRLWVSDHGKMMITPTPPRYDP